MRRAGFSLRGFLLAEHGLQGMWASVAVGPGPSCPAARGIFPDRGSNQYPLPRQADSQHWTTREVPIYFYLSVHVAELSWLRHMGCLAMARELLVAACGT